MEAASKTEAGRLRGSYLSMRVAAVLCAAVGIVVYIDTFNCGFCFDDLSAITENQDLRPETPWLELLRNDFWGTPMHIEGSHKSYRPLTVATFRLNYMLHELQPLGYHLVNVLLHSAVCYLYVLLCGVVFSEVWPALIAGLLFAVHPIHTEAVAGLVGRADLMCALFTITTLFCYKNSLTKTKKVGRVVWFMLCLASTLCAALSKEIGITATGLCLAYHIAIHNTTKSNEDACAAKNKNKSSLSDIILTLTKIWPRALIMGLFSLSFLWIRLQLNQGPPLFHVDNNPALGFPTPYRQLHWSYLCVLNVWLLLSPSQLCAEYAMGTIPPIASLSDPRNLLTLATFACLLSLSLFSLSSREPRHRKILFALSLSTIPFLPASNLFFPVGFVIAERVLYLPSMGFCLLVSHGLHTLTRITTNTKTHTNTLKNLAKTTLVFLLLAQSLKTFTRTFDWQDNLTLFSSALRVTKSSAKMWNFVGNTHFKGGNNTFAEPFFRMSVEVEPEFPPAHINLVRILKRQKRFDEAIVHAQLASDQVMQGMYGQNPHYYKEDRKVFLELARLLLLHTDRFEDALKWSKSAANSFPDWEPAYEIMGKVLIKLGRHSNAKKALEKALELKEDMSAAHFSLGEALLDLRETANAEIHFRRAISLDGQDVLQKFGLVKVILEDTTTHTPERLTEALNMAFDVLTVEPDNGNLTLAIALVYRYLGKGEMALEYVDRTHEINPLYSTYCQDKGKILSELHKLREAEEVFEECERQGTDSSQQFLFSRGTNYLAMNATEKARVYLSRAFDMGGDDVPTRVNYGIALIRTKHYAEALPIMRQLANEFPNNPSYSRQVSILESTIHSATVTAAEK